EGIIKALLDILSTPAFTVSLVALAGLIALRKKPHEVFTGFMRTFIALLIVVGGAVTIVNALNPLTSLLVTAFGFKGVFTLEEVTTASAMAKGLGFEIGSIFGIGFILHLIIVRILAPKTPFKHIYLTGHVMWTMAGAIALVLYNYGIIGMSSAIIGSILLAIYLTIAPVMVWPFVRKITDGQWNIGHTQDFGLMIFGGLIPRFINKITGGKAAKMEAEGLKLPEELAFLKQPGIISGIIMLVVFLVPTIYLGPTVVEEKFSGGTNYIVWAIIQALTFAAGIEILLFGVRTFLGEIIPAFKGISEKLIPGAIAALDVPTIYPFRPVALTLGVIVHVVVVPLATILQATLGSPLVILPNAVYMFFVGATTGILADKEGGIPGVIIGSILSAFWYMFLPIWAYPFLGVEKLGLSGLSMSADCGIWAIIYGVILKVLLGK
ncbi:PTS transporter subunit IIC, partial [Infirmifilum sp. NZ]|uniref:PTS transporter subunit IIC n=1 Tax=Infirmifilum sp. NZ TaxID=2926850 RepID=UPI00279AF761